MRPIYGTKLSNYFSNSSKSDKHLNLKSRFRKREIMKGLIKRFNLVLYENTKNPVLYRDFPIRRRKIFDEEASNILMNLVKDYI